MPGKDRWPDTQWRKAMQDSLPKADVLRILRGNCEDFDTKGMKRKDASDD
jgi:hypothetical protein|tara:strand:+ start:327 stop:476 length:150 start_codon:yes stop_codon:yes gene_type:complete